MKTFWAFLLVVAGFALGFSTNRYVESQKTPGVSVEVLKPEVALVKPTDKNLPDSFRVTEKQVAEELHDGSSLVKTWDWAFSDGTKVEFVGRRPVSDNEVEVVVKVEDTHAYGLLSRRVAKWSGLVKVRYEAVLTDKNETLWYAKTATHLNSKFSPPTRKAGGE